MLHLEWGAPDKSGRISHFTFRSDEPIRLEGTVSPAGHLVVYAYRGVRDDVDQEPDAVIDSDFPSDGANPSPSER